MQPNRRDFLKTNIATSLGIAGIDPQLLNTTEPLKCVVYFNIAMAQRRLTYSDDDILEWTFRSVQDELNPEVRARNWRGPISPVRLKSAEDLKTLIKMKTDEVFKGVQSFASDLSKHQVEDQQVKQVAATVKPMLEKAIRSYDQQLAAAIKPIMQHRLSSNRFPALTKQFYNEEQFHSYSFNRGRNSFKHTAKLEGDVRALLNRLTSDSPPYLVPESHDHFLFSIICEYLPKYVDDKKLNSLLEQKEEVRNTLLQMIGVPEDSIDLVKDIQEEWLYRFNPQTFTYADLRKQLVKAGVRDVMQLVDTEHGHYCIIGEVQRLGVDADQLTGMLQTAIRDAIISYFSDLNPDDFLKQDVQNTNQRSNEINQHSNENEASTNGHASRISAEQRGYGHGRSGDMDRVYV